MGSRLDSTNKYGTGDLAPPNTTVLGRNHKTYNLVTDMATKAARPKCGYMRFKFSCHIPLHGNGKFDCILFLFSMHILSIIYVNTK